MDDGKGLERQQHDGARRPRGGTLRRTVDPWDSGTSPGEVRAVADADLSSSAIDTSAISTVCIELIEPGNDSCDTQHTNDTSSDQILVKLRYPNYKLEFLFFSMTVDLEGSAISRHESAP